MKRIITLFALVNLLVSNAQTTTVTFTPSTENFSNPERGFYHHEGTDATSYDPLSQSSLTNYRVNEKISLILRIFYLENFLTSPISDAYLNNIKSDFSKVRAAGLKCIVRFAYSDKTAAGQRDASKAQILAHINQLKPILTANADVIATVQAGFIGTWGEWYYTDHFGMNPTATDYANRREVLDAILDAIPTNRTVQIRTPKLKQKVFTTTAALTQSQALSNINLARVGHHNDCFLADATDSGTYTNVTTEYPYLSQETKFVPMGGESCDFDPNRSNCDVANTEMALFHWSYMNMDYYPQVIDEFDENNCLNDIKKKLGYRFEFTTAVLPNFTTVGSTLPVNIKLKNIGFASPYNDRTAYIVMRNTITNQEFSIPLSSNPLLWVGSNEITINENLPLPQTIIPGSYQLFLNLPDASTSLAGRPEYSIRFANMNTWEATTGYNRLNHTVNVGAALSIADNNTINPIVYPVPANDELVVELENIADYQVTLFNTLGQNFGVISTTIDNNKLSLNTQSLSEGIYLLRFENGSVNATKRIIVKH